jgi:hypothetical protein
VAVVVDEVEVAVRAEAQAVRPPAVEHPLAPGAHERAVRAIDQDLVLLAGEQVDVVVAVDVHPNTVEVRDAGRELLPARDDRVAKRLCVDHVSPSSRRPESNRHRAHG